MNRLVEQLLGVARLDAIALDVSGVVNLNDAVMGVVETMAPWALAQHRMIAFVGSVKPVEVKGNAHAIADAVRNLVENAVNHSPPGSEVTVTTHRDGCVSVTDHGPGIPARDRERIFERFWRGRGAESQGAGLGLAIVKEIVSVHQGEIRVGDNPTRGAIFTLCFTLGGSGETLKSAGNQRG